VMTFGVDLNEQSAFLNKRGYKIWIKVVPYNAKITKNNKK